MSDIKQGYFFGKGEVDSSILSGSTKPSAPQAVENTAETICGRASRHRPSDGRQRQTEAEHGPPGRAESARIVPASSDLWTRLGLSGDLFQTEPVRGCGVPIAYDKIRMAWTRAIATDGRTG